MQRWFLLSFVFFLSCVQRDFNLNDNADLDLSDLKSFTSLEDCSNQTDYLISLGCQAQTKATAKKLVLKCHKNDSEGITCIGKIASFRNKIAIYIPKNYYEGFNKEFIVHFLGHTTARGYQESFASVINYNVPKSQEALGFSFQRLLQQSARNAVLIVPYSSGQNADYLWPNAKDALNTPTQLNRLVSEVNSLLFEQERPINKLTLTGHSGAYLPISMILKNDCTDQNNCIKDKISELFLFDATYGESEFYAKWLKEHPQVKFATVFQQMIFNAYETLTLGDSYNIFRLLHPKSGYKPAYTTAQYMPWLTAMLDYTRALDLQDQGADRISNNWIFVPFPNPKNKKDEPELWKKISTIPGNDHWDTLTFYWHKILKNYN